jgi:hypothetical protein
MDAFAGMKIASIAALALILARVLRHGLLSPAS